MNFDKQLVIIRGLPGSGKTSLAKEIATKCGYMHFENDHYLETHRGYEADRISRIKAKRWCYWSVRNALQEGHKVVVSNVFAAISHFQDYRDLTESHLVIDCVGEFKTTHDIPEETLAEMRANWEPYPSALRI